MALIKGREVAKFYRSDPQTCVDTIREALDRGARNEPGGIRPTDLSLRDLAEELIVTREGEPCGMRWVKDFCDPRVPVGNLQEAISAVDSTAFANITGQLLVRSVLNAYQNPAFVLSAVIPSVPTPFMDGEKIPGMALPKDPETDMDQWLVTHEAEEYKMLGFGEEYIQTPATSKRGLVIGVTREMIFKDLTGLAARRAAYVGTILGLSKEKRLTDVLIGATNNYQEFRQPLGTLTARMTYYAIADTGEPWVNHLDNNDLVDWTSLDEADNLFVGLTDPNTGEPIAMTGRYIIHTPQKRSTVARILNATELRQTTNTNNITLSANVVRPGLRAIESTWVYNRLQSKLSVDATTAKGYWFYGDVTGAFNYLENWPITVLRAANNSEPEFMQDIVLRYKATESGVAAVIEPRMIQRHRASATSSSSGV